MNIIRNAEMFNYVLKERVNNMNKTYAVYTAGESDNDQMDWYEKWEEAFSEAEKQAIQMKEGESLYLSVVEDGEFMDAPLEFMKDNGIVAQFMNGTRLCF